MKRTVALGTVWTASAAAAVGLGFLAVSLVDASASPGTTPVALTTSAAPSASAPSTSSDDGSSSSSSSSSSTAPPPAASPGEQATVGGTVYAACDTGAPVLASAPAPGWWLDDSNDPGEVEFKNGTLKVEVKISCAGGAPQFVVEGPREDNSGSGSGGGSSDDSSGSGSGSGGDDSEGRSGGGHGSDDAPGDDSQGRSGGGHGSDD
jgi:hypothetical protein